MKKNVKDTNAILEPHTFRTAPNLSYFLRAPPRNTNNMNLRIKFIQITTAINICQCFKWKPHAPKTETCAQSSCGIACASTNRKIYRNTYVLSLSLLPLPLFLSFLFEIGYYYSIIEYD